MSELWIVNDQSLILGCLGGGVHSFIFKGVCELWIINSKLLIPQELTIDHLQLQCVAHAMLLVSIKKFWESISALYCNQASITIVEYMWPWNLIVWSQNFQHLLSLFLCERLYLNYHLKSLLSFYRNSAICLASCHLHLLKVLIRTGAAYYTALQVRSVLLILDWLIARWSTLSACLMKINKYRTTKNKNIKP